MNSLSSSTFASQLDVLGLHSVQAVDKQLSVLQLSAHGHERAGHGDAHLRRALTPKDPGRGERTLLGEYERQFACAFPP